MNKSTDAHESTGVPLDSQPPGPLESQTSGRTATTDDLSRTSAQSTEPNEAELERAIVDAVTQGMGDVAKVLAAQLADRRRARAGNVVDLDTRRKG